MVVKKMKMDTATKISLGLHILRSLDGSDDERMGVCAEHDELLSSGPRPEDLEPEVATFLEFLGWHHDPVELAWRRFV